MPERSVELDPQKNYLFGYHPHGVISLGVTAERGNFSSCQRRSIGEEREMHFLVQY